MPNTWNDAIPVETDTPVTENSRLRFIEKNPAANKTADWKVNGNDRTLWGRAFYYDVKLADKGSDGKIHVTMSVRPVENISVKVLKPDIKCFKKVGGEEEAVSLTDFTTVVKEKTQLVFTTDPQRNVQWIINGNQWSERDNLPLYVHKSRADEHNTITIDYK